MKAIRMVLLLMVVATAARGAETSSMVNERYSAAGRMAIGTESGDTWYGNDSDHPLYCAVTGGASVSGTVAATQSGAWTFDLTKLNGTTVGATNPVPTQLSDGSAAYTGAKTGQLPTALDGSGYLKVHEQGTATVSGTVTVTDGAGALNVIVDSSALPTGAATETTQAAQGIGNYCTTVPLGVAFDPGSSGTDVAATLSGICSGGACKRLLVQNVSSNPCMIQYNSSTGTAGVCVYGGTTTAPYEVDSSRWISPTTTITNLYATTTGTTSCPTGVTVGACNLHLVGCI